MTRASLSHRSHRRREYPLASGASYAYILRTLGEDNAKLYKCDRVTVDSNHTARHFPVQNVAKATYREIVERRAKANGVDFIEGVATAITPIAFFETVMVKSYETLVDSDTRVDVNTGVVAAGRLQSLIDSRDYSREIDCRTRSFVLVRPNTLDQPAAIQPVVPRLTADT